jgi:hypothetical protein
VIADVTVDAPHRRARLTECGAMGIARTDFIRVCGRLAVRVEVSVGDLREQSASLAA